MSNFWDFSVWGTFNLIAAKIMTDFFPAAGVLLPFGYGQGTGQALNYGNIYEMDYGFVDGKSFGLTVAALGFLSASFGGVIHLNLSKNRLKKKHSPQIPRRFPRKHLPKRTSQSSKTWIP